MTPTIGAHSRVVLHALKISREDDTCIVGRVEQGDFVAMPDAGVHAIGLLREGKSIAETEAQLSGQGPTLDVLGFVSTLCDCGFIQSVDGVALDTPHEDAGWTPPRAVRVLRPLLGPVGDVLAVTIALIAVYFAVRYGRLPVVADILVSPSPSVVILSATCVVLVSTLLHELAHLVSGWSVGVPGRIRLSTRFDTLVLETEVPALWSRPRAERLRFYLAGMRWDLVLGSAALLLQFAVPAGSGYERLLRFVVLAVCGRLLFETQIFLRTDLYYALMEALKCRNLNQDAIAWLRSLVDAHRRPALATLPAHEARAAKGYALLLLLAWSIMGTVLIVWAIPALVALLMQAYERSLLGLRNHDALLFIDGFVPLCVEIGSQVLFFIIFARERRRAQRRLI